MKQYNRKPSLGRNESFLAVVCLSIYVFLSSCSLSHKINKVAKETVIDDPQLTSAHIGISIYDPSSKKYVYHHNGDKYFTPASNTKIATCYAAMKYLGDSLIGLRYKQKGDTVYLLATGDPTLLHPDFAFQPVAAFLKGLDSNKTILLYDFNFRDKPWGAGWSWDDYTEDYMAERSALPVYGNVVAFEGTADKWALFPSISGRVIDSGGRAGSYLSKVERDLGSNTFTIYFNGTHEKKINAPFFTDKEKTNVQLLQQLTKAQIKRNSKEEALPKNQYDVIHSQPTDSLLRIMMHRSDNFYAEQSLLMIGNELVGEMSDEKIIDTLIQTDYKEMPQSPSWVDGSGLSRYNLFTPDDFVFILNKMKNEFDWGRVIAIFPTGGEGTLATAYEDLRGKIFAKTGTLSNNAALSGFLVTNNKKILIFSILIANHRSSAANIRNSLSKFLAFIINSY
jgi:D-alanyl-D-alanine carboxypeptidase/D-alanyl-D-alanine-endopeptidase (penicillin-binding protein 4)